MDTDRNLLFGILALQLEFVDSSQFTEACAAWAVARHKTLAEILVERGWMTPSESNEVEQLVVRKIEKHAGDAHKSLVMEATGEMPPVVSRKSSQFDATLDSSVKSSDSAELQDTLDSAPSGYTQLETLQFEVSQERSRYSLTKMHGEGGIGRVWQAHDQRLNRQVALKEIRPDREASATAMKRFAKEAQITSQLEHPNIVPVYELCGGPDSSRSFYTMRFVRGDTFRDAIDLYHRHRREGTATELELRELLNSFIAICNALGYAHSRGVLHRDLKPSNVMVGSFGEVVVLDWGLAKMIDQPDDDDENLLNSRPISVTDDVGIEATMQGAVLGTLPYMAPEQAAGRIDKIDTRTDIYGLGAILFAVLTGNHPHRGTSTREVRAQILNEPTPHARSDDSKIHPGLDAICAKAMAKKRSERYAKAHDLAEDIRRWLADEPVECYTESMSMRVGRWLRRHRTWTQAIAAALLIVTAVSVVSVMIVDHARRAESVAKKHSQESLLAEQKARQAESVAKELAQESLLAEQKARQAESVAKKEAQDSLLAEQKAKTEATRRFEEARDAVDTMMTGVSEVLAYFPGMQVLREQLLTQAVERYEQFAADNSEDPELQVESARAMIRLGDVFRGLSKYDLAKSTYEDAAKRMQLLLDGDSSAKDARLQLASAKAKLGALHADLGDYKESLRFYDESLRLYDEQLKSQGNQLLEYERTGVAVNRAMLLNKRGMTGDANDALDQLEAAAQVFKRLSDGHENPVFSSGLAMAKANIANVLISSGRNFDAIAEAHEAMALYSDLVDKFPDHPPYLESLAATRLDLAFAYRKSGRDREELSMYEAALDDYGLLIASRSDVPIYRERQAGTQRELALFLHTLGDNHAAHEAITTAIVATEALLNTQIPLAGYHEQWALEQATLARILSDLDNAEEAMLRLGDAIERYDLLIESNPDYSAAYKTQRAACQNALGTIYQKTGDDEAALATLKQAASAFEELSTADPNNAVYRNGLAWTYSYLADLHWQMEQSAAARDYYDKALQLRLKLTDEPEHLNNLARLIVACRDPEVATGDRAIEAAQQAVALAPENARFATTLGSAYAQFGKYDQAIEALRSVDKLGPRGGTTHEFWLAFALAKRNAEGDMNEARNRFDQAVKRMELHSPGRSELIRLRDLVESLLAAPTSPEK